MCGRVIHKINFQTLWQLGSSMSMTEWNIMRAAMTGQTGVMQDIDFPSTYKWSNCVIIRINNDQEMSWYHLLSLQMMQPMKAITKKEKLFGAMWKIN